MGAELYLHGRYEAQHRNDDDDDDDDDDDTNKESRPVVTYAFLLYPFLEHHFHV